MFLTFSLGEVKTHVSARETDERAAERLSNLAPVMSQLDQDLSSKVIEISQIILEDAGRLPKKPRELQGRQIRPEYISALAQAAKVADMNAIERFNAFVTNTSAGLQDPTLLQKIDGAKMIDIYGETIAVNPAILVPEEEFQQRRQMAAMQAQQQALISKEQAAAATVKDLSQAKIGEGSMLDTYLQASQV